MTGGHSGRTLLIEMEYEENIQLETILHFLQPVIDTYRTEYRSGKQYAYITVIA